jgi:hypothetical protein
MPDARQRNPVDSLPRQEKTTAASYAAAGETASAAADLPPPVTFSSVAPLANLKASTHSRFVLSTMDLSSGETDAPLERTSHYKEGYGKKFFYKPNTRPIHPNTHSKTTVDDH